MNIFEDKSEINLPIFAHQGQHMKKKRNKNYLLIIRSATDATPQFSEINLDQISYCCTAHLFQPGVKTVFKINSGHKPTLMVVFICIFIMFSLNWNWTLRYSDTYSLRLFSAFRSYIYTVNHVVAFCHVNTLWIGLIACWR